MLQKGDLIMSPEKSILNIAIREINSLSENDLKSRPELSVYSNPLHKKLILNVLEKRKLETDLKPLGSFL